MQYGGQRAWGAAGLPINSLMQFANQGLPVAAMAHSFHVRALLDPTIRSDKTFQKFSLIELNELHHQIAMLGSLLRLAQGDQTAAADLGVNVAGFLQNRSMGLQLAQQLPASITQNPAVMQMMALTDVSQRQVTENLPMLQQVVATTGASAPGVLVTGDP